MSFRLYVIFFSFYVYILRYDLLVIHKGQAMSGYYRVINKTGGYTWMQTCATLICSNPAQSSNTNNANNKNVPTNSNTNSNNCGSNSNNTTPSISGHEDQDQSVICVNYVLR